MFSIDSSGDVLSPYNIPDPLLRAEFFREIRLAQTARKYRGDEWAYYVIQPADILSPELIAWKIYGVDELKWLIMVATGLDDSREALQSGVTVWLPSTSWIYERLRFYSNRGV